MCSWTTQIVRGIPLPPLHGLFFVNSSKVSFTCCITHVVRTIQIVREETCCHHIGYSFRLAARFLLYAPSHRQHSTGWKRNTSMHPPWGIDPTTNHTSRHTTTKLHLALVFHEINSTRQRTYVVDPLSYFSFQPVLHDWCNKGRGMCYPVCGMVHIKEPLLLIDKSSLCGGSGFPFSLSEYV